MEKALIIVRPPGRQKKKDRDYSQQNTLVTNGKISKFLEASSPQLHARIMDYQSNQSEDEKMDNVDLDEEGNKKKLSINSTNYQTQECILYGTIYDNYLPDLERRLAGLCDPGSEDFHEHEMSFSLRTGPTMIPDVSIKLRRKFKAEPMLQNQWIFRYIGVPEPDQKCPVIVRKVINSVSHSNDMMNFAKTLGLRMDYEFMAKGKLWTKGNIKVTTSSLTKSERAGHYDADSLKSVADSILVEISTSLPESAEYLPAAKQIRDFADQLMPLVYMEKVDYWKKYCSTGTFPNQNPNIS